MVAVALVVAVVVILTSTSYSTNLPEYAKPYYEELLKQTGKQTLLPMLVVM
jgi:FlaG/FlaF family flagellin (archaellin)